ncbi:hypothetical protein GDO81_008545 [Engystomops pustulosus]|uniref:Uncharacterized protein n=1 Tax=Engystomops pustulosus TaxID=76066 RepID=A0AAV7CFF2_ENGPU|nr:hypothetical protein GDO81_008545 [Engystomops pustulosus]
MLILYVTQGPDGFMVLMHIPSYFLFFCIDVRSYIALLYVLPDYYGKYQNTNVVLQIPNQYGKVKVITCHPHSHCEAKALYALHSKVFIESLFKRLPSFCSPLRKVSRSL